MCRDKEIEAYRRSVLEYEEKHEKLLYMLHRLQTDISRSKKSIAKQRQRLDDLKVTYAQKNRVLQSLEKAITKANYVRFYSLHRPFSTKLTEFQILMKIFF